MREINSPRECTSNATESLDYVDKLTIRLCDFRRRQRFVTRRRLLRPDCKYLQQAGLPLSRGVPNKQQQKAVGTSSVIQSET